VDRPARVDPTATKSLQANSPFHPNLAQGPERERERQSETETETETERGVERETFITLRCSFFQPVTKLMTTVDTQ
jgi:hypothetical protein